MKQPKYIPHPSWDNLKLDEEGQPILPKQLKCVIGTSFLTYGEIYEPLPFPYKLSKLEVKRVLGKNGMFFMRFGDDGMSAWIQKYYFEPIW